MDVDLEQIPAQLGTAVLDAMQGEIIKATGDLKGDMGEIACKNIYRILQVLHRFEYD
jgi:hypothetical protein